MIALREARRVWRQRVFLTLWPAIANLERTGVEIAGGFWVLNAYRW